MTSAIMWFMALYMDARLPLSLWHKVRPQPGGCWLWTGRLAGVGYGWTTEGPAHRLIYKTLVGPIPPEHDLHHTCAVKTCVNPEHVTPLSKARHAKDSHAVGGRQSAKETCPQGHPYSPENTRLEKRADGGEARRCLTCEWERGQRRRTMPVGTSPRELGRANTCKAGHDLTDAYVKSNGSRSCRECAARRAREARALLPPKPHMPPAPDCPNGHVYATVGVYLYKGKRMCMECRRDADRRRKR